MLISEYLKLKKELKKELLREKLKKEIQQNSVFENNIFDFFDLVRSGNLGETDIYKFLKDLTDNFNIENFIKEIKVNLVRKIKRMKELELLKSKLPDTLKAITPPEVPLKGGVVIFDVRIKLEY